MYAHVWQIKLLKFSIIENNPPKKPKNQKTPNQTKNPTPPPKKTLQNQNKTKKKKKKLQKQKPWHQGLKFLKGKKSKVYVEEYIKVPQVPVNWINFCEPLICSK